MDKLRIAPGDFFVSTAGPFGDFMSGEPYIRTTENGEIIYRLPVRTFGSYGGNCKGYTYASDRPWAGAQGYAPQNGDYFDPQEEASIFGTAGMYVGTRLLDVAPPGLGQDTIIVEPHRIRVAKNGEVTFDTEETHWQLDSFHQGSVFIDGGTSDGAEEVVQVDHLISSAVSPAATFAIGLMRIQGVTLPGEWLNFGAGIIFDEQWWTRSGTVYFLAAHMCWPAIQGGNLYIKQDSRMHFWECAYGGTTEHATTILPDRTIDYRLWAVIA